MVETTTHSRLSMLFTLSAGIDRCSAVRGSGLLLAFDIKQKNLKTPTKMLNCIQTRRAYKLIKYTRYFAAEVEFGTKFCVGSILALQKCI